MGLIVRCGDSKQNVKEMAIKTMEKLGEERNIKPALVASLLYRKKGLPKVCEDYKHLVGLISTERSFRDSDQIDSEVWVRWR